MNDLRVNHAGTVFDVSSKRATYGPGGSYHVFAGKDASRALGMSSLKVEDAVPDYSTLSPEDTKTLNDWHGFFVYVFHISHLTQTDLGIFDLSGNDTTS